MTSNITQAGQLESLLGLGAVTASGENATRTSNERSANKGK